MGVGEWEGLGFVPGLQYFFLGLGHIVAKKIMFRLQIFNFLPMYLECFPHLCPQFFLSLKQFRFDILNNSDQGVFHFCPCVGLLFPIFPNGVVHILPYFLQFIEIEGGGRSLVGRIAFGSSPTVPRDL